jgi:hypothetical protein
MALTDLQGPGLPSPHFTPSFLLCWAASCHSISPPLAPASQICDSADHSQMPFCHTSSAPGIIPSPIIRCIPLGLCIPTGPCWPGPPAIPVHMFFWRRNPASMGNSRRPLPYLLPDSKVTLFSLTTRTNQSLDQSDRSVCTVSACSPSSFFLSLGCPCWLRC